MMTKRIVLAVCAAIGASAAVSAADVKMYGCMDTGFTYTNVSNAGNDRFEMSSGNYAGPRWGLKGAESLGNNVSVGFILESGFSSDNGTLGQNGGIFGREAQVWVKRDLGTIGAGRFGPFTSGSSSMSWYWDMEPFETGYTDAGIQATQVNVWRLNSNSIYYMTPSIAGFKAGVQYSFSGTADKETDDFSDNNSFANAAIRWDGEQARAILGVEWERFGTHEVENSVTMPRRKDAVTLKLAGAWNPAGCPVTMYVGVSTWQNADKLSDSTWDDDGKVAFDKANNGRRLDGTSAYLGGKYTVGNADVLASVQYLDGKNKADADGKDTDFKRYVAALGCHYHLSGRTMLYGVVSYADGSGFIDRFSTADTNRTAAHLGLTHWF